MVARVSVQRDERERGGSARSVVRAVSPPPRSPSASLAQPPDRRTGSVNTLHSSCCCLLRPLLPSSGSFAPSPLEATVAAFDPSTVKSFSPLLSRLPYAAERRPRRGLVNQSLPPGDPLARDVDRRPLCHRWLLEKVVQPNEQPRPYVLQQGDGCSRNCLEQIACAHWSPPRPFGRPLALVDADTEMRRTPTSDSPRALECRHCPYVSLSVATSVFRRSRPSPTSPRTVPESARFN